MIRKLTMVLVGLFFGMGIALAQITASGTITDAEDGEPVVGATIKVVGTKTGTISDVDGRFSIEVPSSNSRLEIQFIGYESQTVTAAANLQIVLRPEAQALDEVMVIAYGSSKKSSFTGSAQSINNEKLELRPITSITKGIEGSASGVLVTSGSGQPGSSPSIRIRGFGSINASSSPLYVVDGVPYDGSIASINPSDIESMTLLKDASAGTLYGARGANGVVMITTKKGKEGKANVKWRSTVGWSSRALKQYSNVSQKDFVQLVYEGLRNGYVFSDGMNWTEAESLARNSLGSRLGGELYNPFKNYTWDQIIDPTTGYVRADARSAWNENWMDAVKRNNAFRHEHQLSVSGGTEKTKYMFSLGYMNEDGILKTTNFQRYNARVNVETQVTDWFQANANASLGHTIQNFSDYEDTNTSNVWFTAQFINPLFPVYLKDADGNSVYNNGRIEYDWGENGRVGSLSDFNSLGSLILDKADRKGDVAGLRTGLVFGSDLDKFGIFKGIKLAFNFGADYHNSYNMRYMNSEHGNQKNAGGLLTKYTGRTQSYTFNQLLTWNRSFGNHNIDVLLGHEWYEYKYSYLSAGKTNLVDGILELRPGTTINEADSYSNLYRVNAFLSRINYNFNDTYYLSASLRSDASSRFYRDNNTGTFWSLGGNWRISNEKFMKDISWVDNLSAKISYGMQGNDNILDSDGYPNYYLWQSLYDLSYANANNKGGFAASLENQTITWEKNANFNVGIEGTLFDRHLRFSFEFYNKRTTDMLLSIPMATSLGFSGYDGNVGNMRNRGFEMEISGSPIRTKDFEWTLSWMGATTSNKVTKLTAETPEIISGVRIIKEGLPLNTFYMVKSAGVDPATGVPLYWAYDKDETTGKITREYVTSDYDVANASKYELGSRIPDLYGSLGTTLTYKDISLSVLTTYSIGGKIYDGLYSASMAPTYISSTWNTNALRRWQKPGDITDVPRVELGGMSYATDRFLVDASYFAIKNITLSYSLPKSLTNKLKLGGVRVFGSFDNVALFTHLDGMDPQYNFSGGTNYDYAPNKTLQFGLEVNF